MSKEPKIQSYLAKFNLVTPTVEKLLRQFPHLRDNDNKLVATVQKVELERHALKDVATFTVFNFLKLYADGRITTADLITRARRKLQQDNVELRGELWEKRHEEAEDVRQNINEYPDDYPPPKTKENGNTDQEN